MKKSAPNKSNAPDLQKRRSVACATIDQAISAQLNVFECEQCKVKMCDHVLADTEPVDREWNSLNQKWDGQKEKTIKAAHAVSEWVRETGNG